MFDFFYDRQNNCIVNTKKAFEFFNNYYADDYNSFEEYLNTVYPNFVWIEKY